MSTNLQSCFEHVFGLSRTECDCFEEGKPADYNVSDSGIYLDELEGFNLKMAEAATDCEKGNLWELMDAARRKSVEDFGEDFLNCIRSKTAMRRTPWKGIIGDWTKKSRFLSINHAYAGLKLFTADIIGGFMRVKRIGLWLNQTGTTTVKIWSNLQDDPHAEIVVNTIYDKLSWYDFAEPLELSMHTSYPFNPQYFFTYEVAGRQPKDILLDCACGGGYHPSWNPASPDFNTGVNKGKFGWADYTMASGFLTDDLSRLVESIPETYTQGVVVDLEFGCKAETIICNETVDYDSNPYAKAMAFAMRFKAGANLVDIIFAQNNVNRYTLAGREFLIKKQADWLNDYNARTWNYLCEEIATPENINSYSDCFTCKNEQGFKKVGMLITGSSFQKYSNVKL